MKKIKINRTDLKLRYVIAEIEGKEVTVSFYDTFWTGIHNISFRVNGKETKAEIKSAYPGIIRKMKELALLIRISLENTINRITKRTR